MKKQFLLIAYLLLGYVSFSQNVVLKSVTIDGKLITGIKDDASNSTLQNNLLITEAAVRQMINESTSGNISFDDGRIYSEGNGYMSVAAISVRDANGTEHAWLAEDGSIYLNNGAISSDGNGVLSVTDGLFGYGEVANKNWVQNQGFLYNSPYDGSVYYASVAGRLDDGFITTDGYGTLYATSFIGQFGGYINGCLPFMGGRSTMYLEYLDTEGMGSDPLISFSGNGWSFFIDPSYTDNYSFNIFKMPNHSGTFALSVNGINTDVSGNVNIKDGLGKTKFTPNTGGSITLTNNAYNIVAPNASLSALTVSLPSSPSDGDVVEIKFTKAITAVTYSGTVADPITSPTLGMLVKYKYDSQSSTWY